MSDTAYLFVLAGIWSLISVAIVFFVPKWPAKMVVFALLVGIPFWELPYGYYNFEKLCREEARLLVMEKIPPQENVCADFPFLTLHKELLKAGFPVVEARRESGEVKRYSRQKNGEILEISQKFVSSPFCMTYVNNIAQPWRVLRHEVRIVRSQDHHMVARQSSFDWSGMWWQADMHPLLGRGGVCAPDANAPTLALRQGAG